MRSSSCEEMPPPPTRQSSKTPLSVASSRPTLAWAAFFVNAMQMRCACCRRVEAKKVAVKAVGGSAGCQVALPSSSLVALLNLKPCPFPPQTQMRARVHDALRLCHFGYGRRSVLTGAIRVSKRKEEAEGDAVLRRRATKKGRGPDIGAFMAALGCLRGDTGSEHADEDIGS